MPGEEANVLWRHCIAALKPVFWHMDRALQPFGRTPNTDWYNDADAKEMLDLVRAENASFIDAPTHKSLHGISRQDPRLAYFLDPHYFGADSRLWPNRPVFAAVGRARFR
jgi:hypothetical protein